MASRGGQPRAGTVESLVKYWVARGKNVVDIVNRVTERFPNSKNLGRISDYLSKWGQALGKALNIPKFAQLSDRQLAQLAQTGTTGSYSRVTVDVTWASEKANAFIDGTWYVDVPRNLFGQALRDYVYNQLVARMQQYYGDVIKTLADAAKIIISANIRHLE